MSDPHDRLARALLAQCDGLARICRSASRPWASVTFVGARHRFLIAAPPAAADWLTERLEELEFVIPGHLVADIALIGSRRNDALIELEIEALTIKEG
jgi:hypothetical protein